MVVSDDDGDNNNDSNDNKIINNLQTYLIYKRYRRNYTSKTAQNLIVQHWYYQPNRRHKTQSN